jgi:hypothetical protein
MLLQFVTQLFVTCIPFIDVKLFDTVHLDHFRPQMYKFHKIFNFNQQVTQSLYKSSLDKHLALQMLKFPKISDN